MLVKTKEKSSPVLLTEHLIKGIPDSHYSVVVVAYVPALMLNLIVIDSLPLRVPVVGNNSIEFNGVIYNEAFF